MVPEDRALLAEAQRFRVGAMLVLTSMDESGNFFFPAGGPTVPRPGPKTVCWMNWWPSYWKRGTRVWTWILSTSPGGTGRLSWPSWATPGTGLHQVGLSLHVDLAPKTHPDQEGLLYEGHDYGAVGTIADSVLLMTYEWGYAYGLPMAVAPLPQVAQVVRYAVTEIPPGKIQLGIPNYGYD